MTADVFVLAVSSDYAIPLAAFIVSAVGFAYGVWGSGRWSRMSGLEEAMAHRIDDLTGQIKELREQNRDCARRCRDLESENLAMLRKLAKMENGSH